MKMLIADDDRDLRELIGFTLTQAGYLVLKTGDGPSALQTFENESPDLVVLDINMPGMSGFQVCESIRKRSRVPVIMLTVRGEEEDLVRALELGADDYLTKPFIPVTPLARIKALLRRAAAWKTAPPLAAGPRHPRHRRAHRPDRHRRTGTPDQARAAAITNAPGQLRPHRQLRQTIDPGLGTPQLRRPSTPEAVSAPAAAKDRGRSRDTPTATNRIGGGI